MSGRQDPVLSQFAIPPGAGGGGPFLEVDPSTGLLHEPGNPVPFVEALIEGGEKWRGFLGVDSIVTRTLDPVDPDLVRDNSTWLRFGEALSTTLTKTTGDPEDPDLVRALPLRWFVDCAATQLTEDTGDAPDPDLVRAENPYDPRRSDA